MNFDPRIDDCYTKRFEYNEAGNVVYAGAASPGTESSAPGWSIRRYTYTGNNLTVIEWARGNNETNNVWDDRATLAYA